MDIEFRRYDQQDDMYERKWVYEDGNDNEGSGEYMYEVVTDLVWLEFVDSA